MIIPMSGTVLAIGQGASRTGNLPRTCHHQLFASRAELIRGAIECPELTLRAQRLHPLFLHSCDFCARSPGSYSNVPSSLCILDHGCTAGMLFSSALIARGPPRLRWSLMNSSILTTRVVFSFLSIVQPHGGRFLLDFDIRGSKIGTDEWE